MGTGALTVASAGQDIPASHHNELVEAFLQTLVPRNASRTAEDLAGSLGQSTLRWLRAYVETYHIGTASANLTISEAVAGEIHILRDVNDEKIIIKNGSVDFYVGNSLIGRFNGAGLSGTYLTTNTVAREKLVPKPFTIAGPANGSVGSTLANIASVENTFTAIAGRTYVLTLTSQQVVFGVQVGPSIRYNIVGPSQPELQMREFSPPSSFVWLGASFEVLYTAPAAGVFTVKVYGRYLADIQDMYNTAREM